MLSTDLAPTILERLGVARAVGDVGAADPGRGGRSTSAAIDARGARMAVISERRGPVIGLSLLVWLRRLRPGGAGRLAAGLRAVGGPAARAQRRLPAAAAAASARRSSRARRAEQLLVDVGAPLLAALTSGGLRGYRALAVASAHGRARLRARRDRRLAADLALAARPQSGPRRPLLRDRQRARGAAGGARRRRHRRRAGRLLAGLPAAAAPLASSPPACSPPSSSPPGASAPTSAPRSSAGRGRGRRGGRDARRRRAAAAHDCGSVRCAGALWRSSISSPAANAHLTRSVLDAGGLGDLADVAQRRLQLSAHSFAPARRPRLPAAGPRLAALAPGARDRRLLAARRPAMRAGLLGALAATAGRHPRQRLRRPPARDRHRLSARLRRLRLGRSGRPDRPDIRLRLRQLRANRPRLAIFLDLPGRREPARGGARRGVPRPRPPRSRARPLRSARPAQPRPAPCRAPSRARCPTT